MEDLIFLAVQSYISKAATHSFSMAQYDHNTIGSPVVNCRRKLLCFFEGRLTQAHTQAAYYTDCIWEVSISLLSSPTTRIGFCVLPFHGPLSLHVTRQQKIAGDYDMGLTGDDESLR
jgi:hypothetical protein